MERRSRTLANLTLAFASAALTLLAVEAIVRIFVDITDIPWHRPDPVVGYGLEPHQQGRWIVGNARGDYRINGWGFNNDHEYSTARVPGRYRVAVIGDSFVEAFQVPRGKRFFDLLEAGLRQQGLDTEIYSFGVSGYGTGQEKLLLESQVLDFHPDLVLVVFVENDLRDTACVLSVSNDKPCFRVDEAGRLEVSPVSPHRPNMLGRILLRSATARYLFVQCQLLERLRSLRNPVHRHLVDAIYLTKSPPEWAEAWRVVEACLTAMAGRCLEAGIPFMLTNHVLMIDPPGDGKAGGAIDRDQPSRVLSRFAQSRHLNFVDLTPVFRRAAMDDSEPLTVPGDEHWSVRGHKLVAETLAGPIRDALLGLNGKAARRGLPGPP